MTPRSQKCIKEHSHISGLPSNESGISENDAECLRNDQKHMETDGMR